MAYDKNNGNSYLTVDMFGVNRKVWLVKVPKYLSERMERAKPMENIGKMIIKPKNAQKSQILFNILKEPIEEMTTECPNNSIDIPTEHQFSSTKLEDQTLIIFSESNENKIAIEGNVVQRGECRPNNMSARYINMNKERMKNSIKTYKPVQQLDRSITVFRPITNRPNDKTKPKKDSPIKKFKKDRQTVENMLFLAFEKHQYYSMKDLVRLTLQPVYYLKEIVRQICIYNIKNPHKYLWELKPEFRHYSQITHNKENV